jgi:hypothetical protein
MPRKMRTPKTRYELTDGQLDQLCNGHDFLVMASAVRLIQAERMKRLCAMLGKRTAN